MTDTFFAADKAPLDRDEAEFDRDGANNYTRAFDDAPSLWIRVFRRRAGAEIAPAIQAFRQRLDHLASYRPEAMQELVIVPGGRVSLGIVPDLLLARAAA